MKVKKWFHELRLEFKKISWPTKKDWVKDIPYFIVAFLIVTVAVFVVDSLFSGLVAWIVGLL